MVVAGLGQGAGSPFATEIATHYQGGVGLLFAFDLTSVPAFRTGEAEGYRRHGREQDEVHLLRTALRPGQR